VRAPARCKETLGTEAFVQGEAQRFVAAFTHAWQLHSSPTHDQVKQIGLQFEAHCHQQNQIARRDLGIALVDDAARICYKEAESIGE